MPERIEKLRAIVGELENELQSLEPLDDETCQVLQAAIDELREALGQKDTDALQSRGLIDRLQATEEKFSVSHPNLSGIVLRIIDALGQLGI